MSAHLVVLAKAPVPGRVKTRLCPPCTPSDAARIAAAALADTLDTAGAAPAARRTLVLDGEYAAPAGWDRLPQRGSGLAERIVHAFRDTRVPGLPTVLIGMDTPQVTAAGLTVAMGLLGSADAVLGPAADGGWWALGLRDPRSAEALRDVPTSTGRTGARTLAALRGLRLTVELLPVLRDVDTAADATEVAALCPAGSRFAATVPALVPA